MQKSLYLLIFLFSFLFSSQKKLIVSFLYVDQGDSICILTPNGRVILLDGGPVDENFDAGEEIIIPYLKKNNFRKIDLIIASHPHRDHIGGLISVIRNFTTNFVCEVSFPYPSTTYHEFLTAIQEKELKYKTIKGPSKINIDPELEVFVLYPLKEFKFDDPNNNSLVIKMTYRDVSFLFTGDIEMPAEEFLVKKYNKSLKSKILKSPHHGSYNSSTHEFLKAVSPEVVVISCGIENRFGYPHYWTLKRYEQYDIKVYRTDIHKTVKITSDGKTYTIETSRH